MKTNPNDPAFPMESPDKASNKGLTIRQYFAAMSMCRVRSREYGAYIPPEEAAEVAVEDADALIKALNDSHRSHEP